MSTNRFNNKKMMKYLLKKKLLSTGLLALITLYMINIGTSLKICKNTCIQYYWIVLLNQRKEKFFFFKIMWHTTWQTMGNHIKITEIHSNEKKNLGIMFNSLKKWCSGFHVQVPLFVARKKMESITLKHEVMQCKIDNFVME